MSEDTKNLAKKAIQRTIQRALEKARQPKAPKPPPAVIFAEEEKPQKSEDALDRPAFRKGGFSKAEKRAYAQQKFMEELVQPPKNPPPEWTENKELLPKKPPPLPK